MKLRKRPSGKKRRCSETEIEVNYLVYNGPYPILCATRQMGDDARRTSDDKCLDHVFRIATFFGIVILKDAPLLDTCDTSSNCSIKGYCGQTSIITHSRFHKRVRNTLGFRNCCFTWMSTVNNP